MNGLNAICKKNVILNVPGKPKSEMKYLDKTLYRLSFVQLLFHEME